MPHFAASVHSLFELDEHLALLCCRANLGMNRLDLSCGRSSKLIFHFHRFHYDGSVSGGNHIANGDIDSHH